MFFEIVKMQKVIGLGVGLAYGNRIVCRV